MVTVDLRRNEKQAEYFYRVLSTLAQHDREQETGEEAKDDALRFFHYGGGIRGGKTFVSLAIGCVIAKRYPGSRGVIIRRTWTDLQTNTIPQFKRVTEGTAGITWRKSKDDYYAQFPNGSKIAFMSENADRDPDMNRFKGLEANWFLLEQLEELRKETYDKCKERVGSLYLPKMPPGLIFDTFNPTYNWVKEEIHDQAIEGNMEPPHYYQEALPSDGDWVTPDQWKAWSQMDEESQNRYIRGSWDFKIDGQFMTAFNRDKHLRSGVNYDPNLETWLSFDFNVDPMTCIVAQTDYQNRIAVIKEFRQPNSDTFALCREIKASIFGKHKHMLVITGDASGNNRNASATGSMTQYQIIQRELQISMQQFKVPSHNPDIASSRTFCNSMLQNYPTMIIDAEQCQHLVKDLQFVMTGRDQSGKLAIQKTGMNKIANVPNQQLGHLLDCFRYFLHRSHPGWLKIPKS